MAEVVPGHKRRPVWSTILYGLIGLVLLVVGISYLLPSEIHVERSAMINAPAEQVFAQVNDLKKWKDWSPWHSQEPDAKYVHSGPAEGVGSAQSWEGKIIGSGSQKITISEPYQRIETALDFGSEGSATSFWTFDEAEGTTTVVWGFDTDMGLNPIARYMGLMMDRWVGADYEQGLSSLKELCEKQSADGR
jgi:hypothetical protein